MCANPEVAEAKSEGYRQTTDPVWIDPSLSLQVQLRRRRPQAIVGLPLRRGHGAFKQRLIGCVFPAQQREVRVMAIRRSTVKEALLYHYALLVADAAVGRREGLAPAARSGTDYWSFAHATFRRLVKGKISPSTILRENKLLISNSNGCAYCGASEDLQWEHIIPRSSGGPDTIDNLVLACPDCNLSKGAKDLAEWYANEWARIPRLVMGKYLKLLMEAHGAAGTLSASEFPEGQGLHGANLHLVYNLGLVPERGTQQ